MRRIGVALLVVTLLVSIIGFGLVSREMHQMKLDVERATLRLERMVDRIDSSSLDKRLPNQR